MSYITLVLNSTHKKSEFDCGQDSLNSYLQKQANQDVKRHLSACFVIVDTNSEVKGYYTLSNASIDKDLIPESIKNKLPGSYNNIPVTLLGRLARDKKYNGERLGETLLIDALKRCFETSSVIGSMAVIVDPVDEEAKNFYLKYGFIVLPDSSRMFITMNTISGIFK